MLFLSLFALILAAEARPRGNFLQKAGELRAHNMISPVIVNGQPAAKGRWPWQLALEYLGSHTCGATLIGLDRVLTAAHCVEGRDVPSRFQLVVGASNRAANDEEEIRAVTAITIHPSYPIGNLYGADVAVLVLDQNVVLNQYVGIATLAATGSNWVGRETWISGWGKPAGTSGSVSTQLLEAQVNVIDNAECASYMPVCCRGIETYHQCIFDQGSGNSGVCQGDSGGPLHVSDGSTWFVDGAASWVISSGADSCSTAYPSVYARASEYRDWILAQ